MSSYIETRKKLADRLVKTQNYPIEHKCYGVDDIPLEVKEKKSYIKQLIDPDILELQNKRWNNNTNTTDNKLKANHKDLQKELFEVKNGFSDVKLVNLKEPKINAGVDVRDLNYYLWNNSAKLEMKEKNQLFDKLNKESLNSSKINRSNILQGKHYETPFERSAKITEYFREIKAETAKLRKEVKKEVIYNYPKASKEKINSQIFKNIEPVIKKSFHIKTLHKKHKEEKIIDQNQKLKVVDYTYLTKSNHNSMELAKSSNDSQLVNKYLKEELLVNINFDDDAKYKIKIFPTHKRPWIPLKKDDILEGRYKNNTNFKLGKKINKDFLSSYDYISLAESKEFKPVLQQPLHQSVYNFFHPGKWRIIESVDSKEVWSCCMSNKFKSKGCTKEHVSGGKYIKDITTA